MKELLMFVNKANLHLQSHADTNVRIPLRLKDTRNTRHTPNEISNALYINRKMRFLCAKIINRFNLPFEKYHLSENVSLFISFWDDKISCIQAKSIN